MIHDPKKPIEPPAPVKDGPRVRSGLATPNKALDAGLCSGCRKPYGFGAEIVEYTPVGKLEPTEYWHSDCWKAANRDAWDRPSEWPWL